MDFSGKSSWPELVGIDFDKAVEIIRLEYKSFNFIEHEEYSLVLSDYKFNRVRVFYDSETNLISITPKRG